MKKVVAIILLVLMVTPTYAMAREIPEDVRECMVEALQMREGAYLESERQLYDRLAEIREELKAELTAAWEDNKDMRDISRALMKAKKEYVQNVKKARVEEHKTTRRTALINFRRAEASCMKEMSSMTSKNTEDDEL
ncbi:MAG: hypothetical protein N4A36_00485 [Candidatus Gracilibacteria bacterium]|jgi:hypothetical protein|nr:hypothetical protein [Candidatus Gracilibacteria bacterium]